MGTTHPDPTRSSIDPVERAHKVGARATSDVLPINRKRRRTENQVPSGDNVSENEPMFDPPPSPLAGGSTHVPVMLHVIPQVTTPSAKANELLTL